MSPIPLPVGRGRTERRRRLAQIRRAVEAGRYRVPAEMVADALLAALRDEAGPAWDPPAGQG